MTAEDSPGSGPPEEQEAVETGESTPGSHDQRGVNRIVSIFSAIIVGLIIAEGLYLLVGSQVGPGSKGRAPDSPQMGSHRALMMALARVGPRDTGITADQRTALLDAVNEYAGAVNALATYETSLGGPKETFFTEAQVKYILAHKKTPTLKTFELTQKMLEQVGKVSGTSVGTDAFPLHSVGPEFTKWNTEEIAETLRAMQDEGPADVKLTTTQARALLAALTHLVQLKTRLPALVQKIANALTPAQRSLWAQFESAPPTDFPADASLDTLATMAFQRVSQPLTGASSTGTPIPGGPDAGGPGPGSPAPGGPAPTAPPLASPAAGAPAPGASPK